MTSSIPAATHFTGPGLQKQALPASQGSLPNILKISQATLPHCFQDTPQTVRTLKLQATLLLPLSLQETPNRRLQLLHPLQKPLIRPTHHHDTCLPPTPP